ncbi:hypothetical protein DV735_g2760, partial [Chaetothyriales sp. CBS 134920]
MTTTCSPFTRAVVQSMRALYPECLADKSFDNTGLLLEAPAVADEAIEQGHSVVVAYHPIIFRGLKSITLADSQQRTLLRLAAHGISVYSPHTAVDIVPGGMGDWLCDIVTGSEDEDEDGGGAIPADSGPARYSALYHLSRNSIRQTERLPHTRSVITASPAADIDAANKLTLALAPKPWSSPLFTAANTGAGRLIRFARPQPLSELVGRIGRAIGKPKAIAVAVAQGTAASLEEVQINTVAVCPGSGASVTSRACGDVVFTGEVSHHDALAITERGGSVVTLFHSNSERGYLAAVMKPKLEATLTQVWAAERAKLDEEAQHGGLDDSVLVTVSERDRDPFGIAVLLE